MINSHKLGQNLLNRKFIQDDNRCLKSRFLIVHLECCLFDLTSAVSHVRVFIGKFEFLIISAYNENLDLMTEQHIR